jgi:general secretion pathway protein A
LSGPSTLDRRGAPPYEEFYGFSRPPFTLAPDPRFLYLSDTHDDAIQRLLAAIRRREGFVVLTGDIGTGKTTLCRAVVERLDKTRVTSFLMTPFVSIEELLKEVLIDFGVVARDAVRTGRLAAATRHELISTLHEFLRSLHPIGAVAVLIVDEAHHLPPEVLEQLRVVANLETTTEKLLQIVLVGQPDLLTVLAASGLRQLDQRISLRARLAPLSRFELEAYVNHRLDVVSKTSSVAFDAPALDLVHLQSEGVPRVINLLCDKALAIGAGVRTRLIGPDEVRGAIADLGLTPAPEPVRRSGPSRRAIAVALLIVSATAATALLLPVERLVSAPPPAVASPPREVRMAPALPPRPVPDATPPLYPPLPAPTTALP